MESLFETYQHLQIDGGRLCLGPGDLTSPYFCYPVGAKAIGFEGCILYCFLSEYDGVVFASNPESCADRYVYPLARNFSDFMRLILACGSANPIEQIVWMDERQFEACLGEARAQASVAQRELLAFLGRELHLAPMENPFAYVKALQANFDGSRIQYSDAYYDALGLERPDGTEPPAGAACMQATLSIQLDTGDEDGRQHSIG